MGILGLGTIPDSDLGLNLEFWTGYGPIPFTSSLVLGTSFMIFRSSKHWQINFVARRAHIAFTYLSWLVILLYLPIFYQPSNGLLNFGDTTYHVIDELLAPYSGRVPYSDYSPQYTGMLGIVLLPLRLIPFDATQTMSAVIVVSNAFNFLLPLLATLIVHRLFKNTSRVLLFAACVTTCFASGEFNGSSTMLKEFSYFARLVPILITVLLLAASLIKPRKANSSIFAAVGVSTAISVLNNADVGLAFGGAMAVTLATSAILKALDRAIIRRIATWFIFTLLAYFTMGFVLGRPFSISSYLGLRLLSPRSIYSPFPFHAFGAHILVLAITVCAIALGIRNLLRRHDQASIARGIIYLVLGLLILSMLTRFVIRPIPQGISGLLIPAFIPASMIIISNLNEARKTLLRVDPFVLLPIFVLGALSIGAMWQMANPIDELRRASGRHFGTSDWSSTPGRVADGYSTEALALQDNFVQTVSQIASSLEPKSNVGYFGVHGHTVQLLTGVKNYLGIPAPESLRFGESQVALACHPLDSNGPEYLIVYATSLPCKNYGIDQSFSTPSVKVYRKSSAIDNS